MQHSAVRPCNGGNMASLRLPCIESLAEDTGPLDTHTSPQRQAITHIHARERVAICNRQFKKPICNIFFRFSPGMGSTEVWSNRLLAIERFPIDGTNHLISVRFSIHFHR